jgi:hypothetical protein
MRKFAPGGGAGHFLANAIARRTDRVSHAIIPYVVASASTNSPPSSCSQAHLLGIVACARDERPAINTTLLLSAMQDFAGADLLSGPAGL